MGEFIYAKDSFTFSAILRATKGAKVEKTGLKPATGISNIHGWLNDRDLDSLMKANAIKNYRAAWNLFRKVHRTGVPVFHKKQTAQKYQTSCQYTQQVQVPNMLTGSVRLLDKRHLRLPKIGRLRFRGSAT